MTSTRRRCCLLALLFTGILLLSGDVAAQERTPPGDPTAAPEVGPEQADRFQAALASFAEADRALGERRWDDAVAAYAEAIAALGDDAVLGGMRDNALYNTACAHARAGRPDAAAEAFAASVEHGIRLLVTPAANGWAARRGLTVSHLLHDPDLDPIREHAGYVAALDGLVRQGSVKLAAAADAPAPVVMVLTDGRTSPAAALAPWREALAGRNVALAACAPPVRILEDARGWVLEDGDERFGVDDIGAVRTFFDTDGNVDPERVFLAASTPYAVQTAWAVWLAKPDAFAGVMLRGGRFHSHWHADAIAALEVAAAPRVVLGPSDDRAADLLEAAGVTPIRIFRGADAVDAARTALSSWLD